MASRHPSKGTAKSSPGITTGTLCPHGFEGALPFRIVPIHKPIRAYVVLDGECRGGRRCLGRTPVSDTHAHPSPAGHGHAYPGIIPVSLVVDTTLRILCAFGKHLYK